jgi:predicted dehydrogenase
MVATLEACTSAAPGFDEAYEVHSAVASIKVEKGQIVYWHHNEGKPAPSADLWDVAPGLDAKLEMFYRQYLNIVSAIQGKANLDVPAADALAVVQTIERIYGSSGC